MLQDCVKGNSKDTDLMSCTLKKKKNFNETMVDTLSIISLQKGITR